MIYLQAIYSNKGRCLQACLCVWLQTMQGRVHFAAFSADEESAQRASPSFSKYVPAFNQDIFLGVFSRGPTMFLDWEGNKTSDVCSALWAPVPRLSQAVPIHFIQTPLFPSEISL